MCYDKNNSLTEIIESSLEKHEDGTIIATPIDGKHEGSFDIDPDTTVSMNLFAFKKEFLLLLSQAFSIFHRQ